MIKITHHYSACVTIETPDVKILCDPWFTDGIYDGSWFLYPKPENEPTQADVIYISHIHPDHYDSVFLKRKFPKTKIIIQDRDPNYLAFQFHADGFEYTKIRTQSFGKTEITILPDFGTLWNIDSVLIVKHGSESVLNLNDLNAGEEFLQTVRKLVPDLTVALINQAGASAYPQVYYDVNDPALEVASKGKSKLFLNRYLGIGGFFDAKINVPFAGQYLLGGKLYYLNPYRGNADDVDVHAYGLSSVVLSEGGTIDLGTLSCNKVRVGRIDTDNVQKYALSLSSKSYLYECERDIQSVDYYYLEKEAFDNAMKKSPVKPEVYICIKLVDQDKWICMLPSKNKFAILESVEGTSPRWEAYPDPRLLYGLLTKKFHWNTAYVGSLYPIRIPERLPISDTEVTAFLNYFQA